MKTIKLALVFSTTILIPGCAKHQGLVSKLNEFTQYIETKDNIRISLRTLVPSDSTFEQKYLFTKHIPIELTIENNNSDIIKLDAENIGLNLEKPKTIARKLHKNLLLTFIWPLAILNPLTMHLMFLSQILLIHAAKASLVITSAILSTVYYTANESNKKITNKFVKNMIYPATTIYIFPGTLMKKYIYIPKEFFKPKFYVIVINTLNGRSTQFNVNLEPNFLFKINR